MATITVQLNLSTTLASTDPAAIGSALASVLSYVQNTIIKNLPANSSVNVQNYTVQP